MRLRAPNRVALLAVSIATAALVMAAPVAADDGVPERIVAVGDVHGSIDGLVQILTRAGLIDVDRRWVGGEAVLVQLGDILDRGADVVAVMELLMRLQEEAAAAGGRVVCLLGNHETMNLLGIRRDVNPEVYEGFRDDQSEEVQDRDWMAWQEYWRRRSRLLGRDVPDFGGETRARWLELYPVGSVEYTMALSRDGRYGRWLRTCGVAARLGDTLFIHGGLSPAVPDLDVEAINRRAAAEQAWFDDAREYMIANDLAMWTHAAGDMSEYVEQLGAAVAAAPAPGVERHVARLQDLIQWRQWSIASSQGPLWFRGAASWDEATQGAEMAALLDRAGVARMVVGHSPQKGGRIGVRFGGRVLLIDTGMLASHYAGGRPSALEITRYAITAVYPDGETVIDGNGPTALVWRSVDGAPLPFRSHQDALDFLREAEVVSSERIPRGVTEPRRVLLRRGDVEAYAIFKAIDTQLTRGASRMHGKAFLDYRDYHLYECAAYELDRMLGLERVPPAVPRTIDGSRGTLQLWLSGTIMDADRRDRELAPPDQASWNRQRQMMEMFDNLVGNTDSNIGNLLIDRSWRLWFIDHTRSFVKTGSLLHPEAISYADRGMVRGLRALDRDEVRRRLDPYLSRFEIDAVMARRDALLERVDELIGRYGEAAVLFDLQPPAGPLAEW